MAGCQFALLVILATVVAVSFASHFRGITMNFIPLDTAGKVWIAIGRWVGWWVVTLQSVRNVLRLVSLIVYR